LRIPLKWGTDSGEVGQRRSEATPVTVMISEVPHLSQDLSLVSASSIISFPSFRFCREHIPFEVGQDSVGKWGAIPEHVGHDSGEVGQPESGCPLDRWSDHFRR
jgi:hypothetical protein